MTFPQAKWYQIGSISCQTLFVVDKNTTEAIFGVFCNEIIDFERTNFRIRANLNRFRNPCGSKFQGWGTLKWSDHRKTPGIDALHPYETLLKILAQSHH